MRCFASSHCGIEIDDLNFGEGRELTQHLQRCVAFESFVAALHEGRDDTLPSIKSMHGRIISALERRARPEQFEIADGVSAVVKNGGGESGVGGRAHFCENLEKVFRLTRAAGGDHGNLRSLADGTREGAIETGLHAVGVHGGK